MGWQVTAPSMRSCCTASLKVAYSRAMTDSPPPEGWYPDPFGRHRQRFWDGSHWTSRVTDGSSVGIDQPGLEAAPAGDVMFERAVPIEDATQALIARNVGLQIALTLSAVLFVGLAVLAVMSVL